MEGWIQFPSGKACKVQVQRQAWINTLKIKEPLAQQIARSISLTSLSRDGVEKTGKAAALFGLVIMLYSRRWQKLWSFIQVFDSSGDKEAFISSGEITVMYHSIWLLAVLTWNNMYNT